jgi:SpoVK/Ycf46/Vps4 family AAA+-type ATPase
MKSKQAEGNLDAMNIVAGQTTSNGSKLVKKDPDFVIRGKPRKPQNLDFSTLFGRARPRDIIVDQRGGLFAYKDISKALEHAQDGTRIVVKPGSYAGFTANVSCEITAEQPGSVTISSRPGNSTITSNAPVLLLRGLIVQGGGADKCSIWSAKGVLALDKCDVLGQVKQDFAVAGCGIYVDQCRVHDDPNYPLILIAKGAKGTITNSAIEDGKIGIEGMGDNDLSIFGCVIRRCAPHSGVVAAAGNASIQHTQITDCHFGLTLLNCDKAELFDVVIEDCRSNAIKAYSEIAPSGEAWGEGLPDNQRRRVLTLVNCRMAGVKTKIPTIYAKAMQITLQDCELLNSRQVLLNVVKGRVRVTGSRLEAAERYAVACEFPDDLQFEHSMIKGNIGFGVNGGFGKIASCHIEGATKAAEFLQDADISIADDCAIIGAVEDNGAVKQFRHRPAAAPPADADLDAVLATLEDMAGLDKVKQDVRREIAAARGRAKLIAAGRQVPEMSYHTVFTGAPGTGKTTIARLLGQAYKGLGILSKGQVVEVGRADLVAEYIGQTAPKTIKRLEEALGGIFFVDEAYQLTPPDGGHDFGAEAIGAILAFMENHRDALIVIVAGYVNEMSRFMNANPGLASRFQKTIHFDDYRPPELAEVYAGYARRDGAAMTAAFKTRMLLACHIMYDKRGETFGNARDVRKIYEQTQNNYLTRLGETDAVDLPLEPQDFASVYNRMIDQILVSRPGFVTFCTSCGAEHAWGFDTPPQMPCKACGASFKTGWGVWTGSGYYQTRKVEKVETVTIDTVLAQLEAMTGLAEVKRDVREMVQNAQAIEALRRQGLPTPAISHHSIFTGSPGTGKTTVARLMGDAYRCLGILTRGHVIEVSRSQLVGSYLGQTAMKTRDILRQAVGGVLFIDEAYTLAGGDGDSFGKEAIDEILAFMENRRDDMIVIAAGYDNEMRKFIELNPGLASRFTKTIVFADFSPPELAAVFAGNARKDQCGMAPAFQIRMLLACHLMHERRDRHFGNARDIRKLYEATQTRRLNRAAASGVAAMVLEARDLAFPESDLLDDIMQGSPQFIFACPACRAENPWAPALPATVTCAGCGRPFAPGWGVWVNSAYHRSLQKPDAGGRPSIDALLAELEAITGLAAVKAQVRGLVESLAVQREMLRMGLGGREPMALHMVFKGAPGTGKTTVARLVGKIFKELGLLTKGHFVEVDRTTLVGAHIGETEKRTKEKLDEAMDGILFIDEAYSLSRAESPNDFGREAIDAVLKRMEDARERLCVIAAGYSGSMDEFLRSNPGLGSRFSNHIIFEDYTPDELVQILQYAAGKQQLTLAPELTAKALAFFNLRYASRDQSFSNGRLVRNVFEKMLMTQRSRLAKNLAGLTKEDFQTLLAVDWPAEAVLANCH